MSQLPPSFYIYDGEKQILVCRDDSGNGNQFIVQLQDGNVRLKSEGVNKKLWIEQGKGATSLAYKLGKLIEGCKTINEQQPY